MADAGRGAGPTFLKGPTIIGVFQRIPGITMPGVSRLRRRFARKDIRLAGPMRTGSTLHTAASMRSKGVRDNSKKSPYNKRTMESAFWSFYPFCPLVESITYLLSTPCPRPIPSLATINFQHRESAALGSLGHFPEVWYVQPPSRGCMLS